MKKLLLTLTLLSALLPTQGMNELNPKISASLFTSAAIAGSYASFLTWHSTNLYVRCGAPLIGLMSLYCSGKAQQFWRRAYRPLPKAAANIRTFNAETPSDSVIIFAHGLGATGAQAGLYAKPGLIPHPYPKTNEVIFTQPFVTFDFPDAVNDRMIFNPDQVALGQENDTTRLEEVMQETRKIFSGKKIILFGLSRGASTVLNLMGDSSKDHSDVCAVIAEAPFDSFDNLISTRKFAYASHVPGLSFIAKELTGMVFPQLRVNGLFPQNHSAKIPQAIPVLLVTSKEDDVVSNICATQLARTIPQSSLLILDRGKHGKYIVGSEKENYAESVREFLKKITASRALG
jgi:predicted esterase